MPVTSVNISGEVKQYRYRTATVNDRFLEVPRELLKEFEENLAEVAGSRIDNHTVYEIVQMDVSTFILFTDHHVVFGRTIEQRRW